MDDLCLSELLHTIQSAEQQHILTVKKLVTLFCLCSVFHTNADRKCQRFAPVQCDALQAPEAAAHSSGGYELTARKLRKPFVVFDLILLSFSQARTVEEKKLWAHHIKRLILENHHAVIPQKVRNMKQILEC